MTPTGVTAPTTVVTTPGGVTTPRVVTNALHKGDWAVGIDLKDAYFHVPIHVRSRRLLRFALTMDDELRIFQFRALPFGLTSAPRVFTKVILPVGHSAHMRAVCLLQYLDDWLLWSAVAQLVECRTRNRENPGSNPRCYRFEVWAFSFTPRRLSRLSCINEYLAIDSGGNVSE